MYDNVKCLGMTLAQWRDEVFHGMYSLGELYEMVQRGVNLSAIVSKQHSTYGRTVDSECIEHNMDSGRQLDSCNRYT